MPRRLPSLDAIVASVLRHPRRQVGGPYAVTMPNSRLEAGVPSPRVVAASVRTRRQPWSEASTARPSTAPLSLLHLLRRPRPLGVALRWRQQTRPGLRSCVLGGWPNGKGGGCRSGHRNTRSGWWSSGSGRTSGGSCGGGGETANGGGREQEQRRLDCWRIGGGWFEAEGEP